MRVKNAGILILMVLGFVFAGFTVAGPGIDDFTPLQGSTELPDWWYTGDIDDENPETPGPNAKFKKKETTCWDAECSNGGKIYETSIVSTTCGADGTDTCTKQTCTEAFTAWYNDKCK